MIYLARKVLFFQNKIFSFIIKQLEWPWKAFFQQKTPFFGLGAYFLPVSLSLAFSLYDCTVSELNGPYLALQHLIRTYLWTLVQNCGLASFSGADLRWALMHRLFCNVQLISNFEGDKAGPTQNSDSFFIFRYILYFAQTTNLLANLLIYWQVCLYFSISRIFKVFGGCNQIFGDVIFSRILGSAPLARLLSLRPYISQKGSSSTTIIHGWINNLRASG